MNKLCTATVLFIIVFSGYSEESCTKHLIFIEKYRCTSLYTTYFLRDKEFNQEILEVNNTIFEKTATSIAMGTLAGLCGMVVGGITGSIATAKKSGFSKSLGATTGIAIGGVLGYTFGNPFGVYLVSKKYDINQNYWFSLLGSALFSGSGILIASKVSKKEEIAIPITLITIPIGSVVFNQIYQKIK